MPRKPIIGVIGGGSTASREGLALAEEVGFLIALVNIFIWLTVGMAWWKLIGLW